jgi:hypothetical protein
MVATVIELLFIENRVGIERFPLTKSSQYLTSASVAIVTLYLVPSSYDYLPLNMRRPFVGSQPSACGVCADQIMSMERSRA